MENEKGIDSNLNNNTNEKAKNVLENGTYSIYGPESGDISFDKIELHSGAGAKRIWKVRSFDAKNIILEVEKFA